MVPKYTVWPLLVYCKNHDVIIKSNTELVAILSTLDGANDVHASLCEANRWDHSAKWDAKSLRLYRNGSRPTHHQLEANLTIARGAVHASLSRAAVDWMVNTVDLSTLLDQLNKKKFGIDEVLVPSLQVSDAFDMPGRFTGECIQKGKVIDFITRVAVWKPSASCRSRYFRHEVCVFGIEDFSWLAKSPNLMANKMMPDFDYAVVDCMHELLYNRTYNNQNDYILNLSYYANQPNVLYHKNRLRPNPNYRLNCTLAT